MKEQRQFIRSIVIAILGLTIVGLIATTSAIAAEYNSQETFLKSTITPFALAFNESVRENSAGIISSRIESKISLLENHLVLEPLIDSSGDYECTGGVTKRVSVSTGGEEGNLDSGLDRDVYEMYQIAVSATGRFVAFSSEASNLVPNDTNGFRDIFFRDRDTDNDGNFDEPDNVSTTRISMGYDGSQANNASWEVSISYDGRYIAYSSDASNIVENDDNNFRDIFRYDRISGDTIRVSLSANNNIEGNSASDQPFISGDGNVVAFRSTANNLKPWDSNNADDIFVREISSGQTFRVSEATGDVEANGPSYSPTLSETGRFVIFGSSASNLDASDGDVIQDVFIHDRTLNTTVLVSVSTSGIKGNQDSFTPFISGDGNFAVFASEATNLDDIDPDINGFADIYVRDLSQPQTSRVSKGVSASASNGVSYTPSISQDGHFIIFASDATNLDASQSFSNGIRNIYLHERQLDLTGQYVFGMTKLISLNVDGDPPGDPSFAPLVAPNGYRVAFASEAANLVVDDENSHSDVFAYNCQNISIVYLPYVSMQFPIPTPTPKPDCEDIILNGGFEEQDVAWSIPNTSYPAKYTSSISHTGDMSMRTGINLADNIYSYSSAWQLVTIPNEATSAELNFYYKPQTTEAMMLQWMTSIADLKWLLSDNLQSDPVWDQQMALILNEDTTHDRTLMSILSNSRQWTASPNFDLMDYKGKTIWVAFTTYNDGINGKTAMYVDDVTLEVCR